MPKNPALGDAYRNIVVTGSGTPGTSTAHAVDAQFNLDAGFGITLVTDVPNNKVTIVNTGNGTGALTTITDTNASGTFYPIFTRPPPGTQTFTIAGGDYSLAGAPIGASAIYVVGSINDPTGISYAMRAALTGIIAGETLQAIRSSDNATLNYTATGPASYSTINGNWTIPVNAANLQTDTLYSITIATGAGEYNAATGTYQMDTMYLDQTTTPLTYNPSTSTITVSNISAGTLNLNSTVSKTYTTPFATATTGTVSELIQNSSIASTLTGLVVAPMNSDSSITGIYSSPIITSSLSSTFPVMSGVISFAARSSATDLATSGILMGTQTSASMEGDLPNTAGCTNVYGTSTVAAVNRGASVSEMSAIRAQSTSIIGGSTSTCSINSVNVMNGSMSLLAPGNTLNITNAKGFNLSSVSIGLGTTVTNYYGLYLASPSVSGSITTGRYGVYSADASASNYFAGTLNVAGHVTVEGVTSTGATGTGNFVFDNAPTILGHPTIEGVTSTGATGTGKFVFDTSPTLVTPILGTPQSGNFSTGTFTWPTFNQNTTGYAANLSGGNNTTLLGSVHYQSDSNVTTQLAPNTTTTKKFLRQTGDGTNGAAPAWDTVTATDVGLGNVTNESKATMFTSPTFTGHPTIEGVTSTGATGTNKFVFDTAPTIAGGSITGLTTFALRDTSAAFDVTLAAVSSTTLTAGRTITLDVVNAARTVKLAGNIDIAGNLTTANTFTTSGNFALTLTTTNTTNVTLPTGTVTLYGTGSGTITSSQLATSLSDETGSGSVVFGTNPTITSPTYGNSSNAADADLTVDASLYELYSWTASFTTTRNLNISNLTAGRKVMIYVRNTNGTSRAINVLASTTATGFAAVNLATMSGTTSSTSITLSLTSGTAVFTIFNAGGNLVGGVM